MSEQQTIAKRIEKEWDEFTDLLYRKPILTIIVIIIFIILGLCYLSYKYLGVEDIQSRNKELNAELNTCRIENKSLQETVAPLLKQAAKEFPGEEINNSLKKVVEKLEATDPYKQPILTASTQVKVTITSNQQGNTKYAVKGGRISFVKGQQLLLSMSSTESHAKQTGKGEVLYSANFKLDNANRTISEPMFSLKETEYIVIFLGAMPKKSKVTGGNAICIFNSAVRIEIKIPPQQMAKDLIIIGDIQNVFSEFKK